LLFLGRALASVGDFEKARSNANHAFELNPLRPIYYDAAMARILWGAGRYEDAKNYSNDCLTKAPGYTQCLIFLIAGSQALGDSSVSSDAVSRLLSQSPNLKVNDAVNGVGFSGDPDANELLAKHLTMAGLSTR
jgi:Tfp pilus assembly protein PilF